MNKKPTTYADFEANYFSMMEEVMADNRALNLSAKEREWAIFSARAQAGYAYAQYCMHVRKGTVTAEDDVECFVQVFQASIAHLYDDLPPDLRNVVMGMIMARVSDFVTALTSGMEQAIKSKTFIDISSEGTGRA